MFCLQCMQGDDDVALSRDMADMHQAVATNLTVK